MAEIQYIRDNAVYVSWQTRKALNYVVLGSATDQPVDALAEQILAEWVQTNHPRIVEHMRVQHERDQDFRKTLKAKQ